MEELSRLSHAQEIPDCPDDFCERIGAKNAYLADDQAVVCREELAWSRIACDTERSRTEALL
jgi:hypothetical protein